MKIKVLSENTAASADFACEHGLSVYLETENSRLLFDTGAGDLYLANARKLGVELESIEYLLISHGHYDHGGGLKSFMQLNKKAQIFIHSQAFRKHYAVRGKDELEYIGLDQNLKNNSRIVLTSDRHLINQNLCLFSTRKASYPLPSANKNLLAEIDGQLVADDFCHEQNLIVEERGKKLLLTGCAHNGILNILEEFKRLKKDLPDYVIGGFHLSRSLTDESDNPEELAEICQYFAATKTKYYTGHCTGVEPYEKLKARLKSQIEYLAAGSELILPESK